MTTVKAGEISFLYLFPHHKESFDALRDMVELLKTKVPVWKKEIYEDDSHVWVQ